MAEVLLPAKGQRWKHWKGPEYRVLCIGKMAGDLQVMVVYGNTKDGVWVRSITEWLEYVEVDGKPVPRFTYVEEDEEEGEEDDG